MPQLSDLPRFFRFATRYTRQALRSRGAPPLQDPPQKPVPRTWPGDRITASWLGHATVLINWGGRWILTDPALLTRIGIRVAGLTLGPRRLVRPALRPRELPPLDLLLVSHAHMDHLDLGTLCQLDPATPVVTHRGVGDLLSRFRQVKELEWGDSVDLDGLRITGTGARHWGARTITDRHRGFGGFLLEDNQRRIFFSGDTAYTDMFRELRAERPVDLAILPIGAYDPWIANHADPEQAWAMGQDLGARLLLPVHHSTFRLSREPRHEPLERFLRAAGPEAHRVVGRRIGETITLDPD